MKILHATVTAIVLAARTGIAAQTPQNQTPQNQTPQNQNSSSTQAPGTQTKPARKGRADGHRLCVARRPGKVPASERDLVGVASTTRAMPPAGSSTSAPVRSYELTGTSDLKTHVGHKVEVKGTLDDTKVLQQQAQTSASTSQPAPEVLKVTSVKPVADTCS